MKQVMLRVRLPKGMRKNPITHLTLLSCTLLCGCASIISLRYSPDDPKAPHDTFNREPYGGVKADNYWGRETIAACYIIGPYAFFFSLPYLIDMPFSLVADTIALPYTIPYTMTRPARLKRQEDARLAALRSVPSMRLYGKIVDQFGIPVEGAICRLSWDPIVSPKGPKRSAIAETGADGCWQHDHVEGGVPQVIDVQKSGFLCVRSLSPYFAATNKAELIATSTKESPVLLTLWKRTCLAMGDPEVSELFIPDPPRQSDVWIDLARRESRVAPSGALPDLAEFNPDIHIAVTYEKNSAGYPMTKFDCQACGNSIGVICSGYSKEEIREAPETGYRKRVAWKDGGAAWGRTYKNIFIKMQNPALYARVLLSRPMINSELTGPYVAQVWVNPFGNRNMALLLIPEDMQAHLNRMATQSLLKGSLLSPQDIRSIAGKGSSKAKSQGLPATPAK